VQRFSREKTDKKYKGGKKRRKKRKKKKKEEEKKKGGKTGKVGVKKEKK